MCHSALTRLEILQRIEDRRLSQGQAATMLGLTDRGRPEAFRDHILRSSASVTQTLARRWLRTPLV